MLIELGMTRRASVALWIAALFPGILISTSMAIEVGAWEAARISAKVIASTATIRRAAQQTRQLYARELTIFPPAGITAKDSFFAREAPTSKDTPGRLYVGIMAPGKSMKTALIRTSAALLSAGGGLAAMAGERFRLPGYVELSGICVHPDARGHGLGAALTLHLARATLARGEVRLSWWKILTRPWRATRLDWKFLAYDLSDPLAYLVQRANLYDDSAVAVPADAMNARRRIDRLGRVAVI